MPMTLGAGNGANSEINVTPLIDVLLVLLIIFMVMPQHRGETAEIPQRALPEPVLHPEEAIVIQLQDSGPGRVPALKINRETVEREAFESKLQDIFGKRIEKVAFLKGDPEIEFQYVAEVVDIAHHAGVVHVGLMGAKD